jgi:REP element-mobilizing transposase RayT
MRKGGMRSLRRARARTAFSTACIDRYLKRAIYALVARLQRKADGRRDGRRDARRAERQLELEFPAGWGGARPGAGRKRSERGNVPHRARPRQRAAEPVHVTLRSRMASLRSQHVFPTVRLALARAGRRDPTRFRILHFSVQRDHLHLVVEAADKHALSSGVRGIVIRVARYVNDLLSRRGPVWADRWHGRALRTPREVRNAFVYVLGNFRKHARKAGAQDIASSISSIGPGIDPFSSGPWFDGWRGWRPASGVAPPFAIAPRFTTNESEPPPVSLARTWLAHTGWRRRGLLALDEEPHAAPRRAPSRAPH